MSGAIHIAGGGLAALYAAFLARKLGERRPLVIVERAPEVGGLLRALDAGSFGRFDQGMHTFTSSGVKEIDDDIVGLLPVEEWVFLRDETRDISGLFFAGTLQRHCHYPDLRLLGRSEYECCLLDFFTSLRVESGPPPTDMAAYGRRRFGPRITERVIEPIVRKLYGRSAAAIDPVVATLLPLDRVALFDEDPFEALLASPLLRERIAYPEQRTLPLRHSSGRFSVYPKRFGAYRLVDALVRRLRAADVRILTGTSICGLTRRDGAVRSLRLRGVDGEPGEADIDELWWTAGVLPLAAQLELKAGRERFEAPKIAAAMNVLVDKRPDVGDLYYFWCFDERHPSFRITNFFNYSPGAPRAGGWPICVEFFLDPEAPRDETALVDLTVKELQAFGVWPEGARVLTSAGHALPVGFPILSLENRRLLEAASREVQSLGLRNLAVTGIQAAWGVVFQPDVLVHTWRTVRARYGLSEAAP